MVVTNYRSLIYRSLAILCLFSLPLGYPLIAAILPEDRTDLSYFSYSGGGVDVEIPAITVRKSIGDSVSLSGTHYVDSISSASIDVVTTASPYEEERTESSVGLDYLTGKKTYTFGYQTSEENDYEATTYSFGVSHSIFGDLTLVNLGYSRGNDSVFRTVKTTSGKIRDPNFSEEVVRQNYKLGISQIATKNWLLDFTLETITDEGYLNNPYRSVRYLSDTSRNAFTGERYPNTRTSHAFGVRSLHYLPYRASIKAEYRYFTDTWGIVAHTAGLGYTHTIQDKWILDVGYRYYTQSAADFYADLFTSADSQKYVARDKELSTFNNHTLSLGVSYEFKPQRFTFVKKGTVNFIYNYLTFNYDEFRDIRESLDDSDVVLGEESLYSFNADTMHLFLSIWY